MTPETTRMLHDRAAECERMAAKAKLPELRENLLDAASCWRALAYDDEESLALRRHCAASPASMARGGNLAGWIEKATKADRGE